MTYDNINNHKKQGLKIHFRKNHSGIKLTPLTFLGLTTYGNIRKHVTGQRDKHTTCCLLDY